MVSTILVAIEDLSRRQRITKLLIHQGYRIIEASSGYHTIELLRRRSNINLLLLDLQMSDINRLNFIDTIRSTGITIPIIVISMKNDEENLAMIIKSGVNDFIIYPFSDLRLMVTIKNTLQKDAFEHQIKNFYSYEESNLRFSDLVDTKSAIMKKTIMMAQDTIKNNRNLLIIGEKGTGRNIIAKTIHYESGHKNQSLHNIQCQYSLLHENFLKSWKQNIKKLLSNITQGTIIFNNIENLTQNEQQFLYDCLTELPHKKQIAIRLIATATPEINTIANEGLFHKKLYEIFAKQILPIPSLRDHREDIGDIAKNILIRIIAETGYLHISEISNPAIHFLSQYDWPGNILELNRILYSALLISNGPLLSIADFPQLLKDKTIEPQTNQPSDNTQIKQIIFDKNGRACSLEEMERIIIKTAMIHYNSRISEVARHLKISRSTLYRKIESLNIKI